MTERVTVTACIIALDERERLPDALASVRFCDEIVVVDSGSTDGTPEIARAAGARVVANPWPGFAAQRNVALNHATSDWVLELDADERIGPELARQIDTFLADPVLEPVHDLVAFPMVHRFLGRDLHYAYKPPDYCARLLRRGAYRHDETRHVHEGLWPHGAVWPLAGTAHHLLASTLGEAFTDLRAYAHAEARHIIGRPAAGALATGLLVRPPVKAAYRVVVDGAWRDGPRGLLRVALDAVSDALVWWRVARRPAPDGPAEAGHFATIPAPCGPVRLVAVVRDGRRARAAQDWLLAARRAGAATDSELVAPGPAVPGPPAADGVPLLRRELSGRGPLGLLRALDASQQLRQIDALVLPDRRTARAAARLLRGRHRGAAAPAVLSDDPAGTVARVTAEVRA